MNFKMFSFPIINKTIYILAVIWSSYWPKWLLTGLRIAENIKLINEIYVSQYSNFNYVWIYIFEYKNNYA